MRNQSVSKFIWKFGLSALVVANFGLIYFVQARPDQLLHLYFLDIGQGDAVLITTPNGQNILIDGGPDGRVTEHLDRLLPPWNRRLDYVALTHAHADHATGLIEVVQRYPVGQFLYNGTDYDSVTYRTLLQTVAERQIPIEIADVADIYQLGPVTWDILHPLVERPSITDPNAGSVVTLLTYGNFKALLTGDAIFQNEADMLSAGLIPDVDVLKVGHHGSQTSSSRPFLDAVRPEVVAIQVGQNNKFGHPSPVVLERLQAIPTQIFRNDHHGTIEVVTDGTKYRVL
jgi:competence protein ComEC